MNTDYNWFGNNATNYAQQPNIPNCNIWLFLNATADESSLLISQPEIIFRLYVYDPNLHEITEFEDSLKPINLTITAANGNVNNTQVDLGECIKFTPSDVGACSVTAKIESYAYTYEFDIAKMNPEMEIENQEIPYGNNVNITLIYNTNATGKVNITLNGKKYTQTFTDVDLNTIISLGEVLPDEYNVIIKYSGDEKFFNATLYATLIVNKLDANLAYESMTIPYSENTIITLTYNDTATGKVNITLNGKKYNLTFTDVDLNKTIALVNVLPDEYNVTVLYSCDDKFINATANATLTVNKLDTNIICDSITTAYNSDDYLIITLKDINGEPVNDVTLTVDFNGSIDNYTTENGTVKIPVKGLAPGNYTAMITFNETSIYLGSNATANVTVIKASAEMSSDGLTTVYQVHKYLNVTLKDADGNPITNDYVNITINGVTYNCKLDENGNAELIIRLNAGTYKATITFENGNYNKTTITTKVVVKKATPKLTAKKKTFKKSKKVKKYTVTLKNNVGKVMKKAKLTMKVKGKTYKATTNSKGKATFKITKLTKKGTFKAKITYKGNKNYNRLIKTVKIKIK
ncbi:hypothetical protein [Methanobrevibacter sp.]|uniref:hypothetical protein n=1 Tax=Methanobrevibacter sp. TaxID=66852 RepID=UPI0025F0F39E|nr:hypothetical protein [Methanobrevibacter sp.]MBQ2665997.1 hypothetical protein [Methanobrevibacter sp.]